MFKEIIRKIMAAINGSGSDKPTDKGSTTPAGKRLEPRRSAARAPSSMLSVPATLRLAAIQSLRARRGEVAGVNRVQRAPAATAESGRSG